MERNYGFDFARCLSMFYVIGVLHLSEYTGMPITENRICVSFIWSTLGVFTFLSGYLLSSKYTFTPPLLLNFTKRDWRVSIRYFLFHLCC